MTDQTETFIPAIRNPAFNAVGTIDCEIEHPQFGWIPYTADPADAQDMGALVYAAALEMEPAPYVAPVPTPAQIIAAFTAAIDAHVETAARAWGYNGAAHLASYVSSTVLQWSAEATTFIAWRDQVWLAALDLLADVQAGEAEPPAAPPDFIATLPELVRP